VTISTDTCIVGAGPAGITAAIQLRRCGLEFVLLERKEVGGLLRNANLIENYPGFPGGISGTDLVGRFRRHMERVGVQVVRDEAVECERCENGFLVRTSDSGEIRAANLVIATGTRPREIDLPGLEGNVLDRLFYEVADLPVASRKHVAIIGAGDAAFDYALNLAGENRVTILNRSRDTKCLPLLLERASKSENISHVTATTVLSVQVREDELELCTVREGQERSLSADLLLCALGREPATDILSSELRESLKGKIKIRGLYFCGDVARGITRQATVAAGDGMASAMEIYLRARESG